MINWNVCGFYYRALKLEQAHNLKDNLVYTLMNFACLAAFREDPLTATRLFGAFFTNIEALQVERELDLSLIDSFDQTEINHFLGLCQAQIDKTEFDQAWNAGCLLSLDEALNEILQERKERIILEP